jgi:hypothetical protein
MQREPDQSQGQPQEQEQVSKGLGWLLKPAAAGEIGVYISGVEGVKEFTPEMRQSLEELMQRLQQEMQDVASFRKCGKLDSCTGNRQGCPVLTSCSRNVVDCPALSFCEGNS